MLNRYALFFGVRGNIAFVKAGILLKYVSEFPNWHSLIYAPRFNPVTDGSFERFVLNIFF